MLRLNIGLNITREGPGHNQIRHHCLRGSVSRQPADRIQNFDLLLFSRSPAFWQGECCVLLRYDHKRLKSYKNSDFLASKKRLFSLKNHFSSLKNTSESYFCTRHFPKPCHFEYMRSQHSHRPLWRTRHRTPSYQNRLHLDRNRRQICQQRENVSDTYRRWPERIKGSSRDFHVMGQNAP